MPERDWQTLAGDDDCEVMEILCNSQSEGSLSRPKSTRPQRRRPRNHESRNLCGA